MEPDVAELIGVAAAAASLYSAHAKTMVPLRVAAIVGKYLGDGLQFHARSIFHPARLRRRGNRMKMKLPRRRFLYLAATTAAVPAFSRVARAQAYPSRPVRIIVGFAPGQAIDIV